MRKSSNIKSFILSAFAALTLVGCAKQADITKMEPEAAYRYLVTRYEKGDYLAVTDGLDYFTLNYSGSSLVDSAQFLMAQAHTKLEQHLLAAEAYNELVRRFPRSLLAPEAMYQAGVSYYQLSPKFALDQEPTHKAMDALQGFIDYYPERVDRVKDAQKLIEVCREKLAHKEFASGVIYMKMKDYSSAKIYFQLVMEQYYDTPWAADAAFMSGEALEGDDKPLEAIEAYRLFVGKFPDHKDKDRAEKALDRLTAGARK